MGLQTLTAEQLKQLPKELRAQVEAMQNTAVALAKAGEGKITLKVGDKGGISVYGFGRFPVSLYSDQWDRLFDWYDNGGRETLKEFQAANKDKLKTKVQAQVEAATNGNGNGNGNGSK